MNYSRVSERRKRFFLSSERTRGASFAYFLLRRRRVAFFAAGFLRAVLFRFGAALRLVALRRAGRRFAVFFAALRRAGRRFVALRFGAALRAVLLRAGRFAVFLAADLRARFRAAIVCDES